MSMRCGSALLHLPLIAWWQSSRASRQPHYPSPSLQNNDRPDAAQTCIKWTPPGRFHPAGSPVEDPPGRIIHRKMSHITVQSHLPLTYHAGNSPHPSFPEQLLVRHMIWPGEVNKNPPQRPSTKDFVDSSDHQSESIPTTRHVKQVTLKSVL